jgi:hypothetical protein
MTSQSTTGTFAGPVHRQRDGRNPTWNLMRSTWIQGMRVPEARLTRRSR